MPIDANAHTVALTLYGEARGQTMLDRLAVAAVVRERFLRPGWWGEGWEGVCKARWQFTAWHAHDDQHRRNRDSMLAAEEREPKLFAGLYALAEYAVGHMTDRDVTQLFPTAEGDPDLFPTHYFSRPLTEPPKAWGEDVEEKVPRWASEFRFYVVRQGRPKRTEVSIL